MAHCHIAEHYESGMMFSTRRDPSRPNRRIVIDHKTLRLSFDHL
jgi:hypothetical protein